MQRTAVWIQHTRSIIPQCRHRRTLHLAAYRYSGCLACPPAAAAGASRQDLGGAEGLFRRSSIGVRTEQALRRSASARRRCRSLALRPKSCSAAVLGRCRGHLRHCCRLAAASAAFGMRLSSSTRSAASSAKAIISSACSSVTPASSRQLGRLQERQVVVGQEAFLDERLDHARP